MGTSGSLLDERAADGDFFVTNCDILVEMNYRSAYREHIRQKNVITIIGALKELKIPYGAVHMKNGEFSQIEGKTGLSPRDQFRRLSVGTGVFEFNPSREMFHMTDLIQAAQNTGMRVGVFPAHRKWVDMGQWSEYNKLI